MSFPDYKMCPVCRVADVEVEMAIKVRDPCPHCGTELIPSLKACCVPDCKRSLPVTEKLPVCRSCGIKIALVYMREAEQVEPERAEQKRREAKRREDVRYGRTESSVVYYVKLDAERIKIGFTTNLLARLTGLRVDRENLLAYEPGGRELERQRHQQFQADRIRAGREDFRPSEALLSWIDGLCEANPLPTILPDTKRVTVRRR